MCLYKAIQLMCNYKVANVCVTHQDGLKLQSSGMALQRQAILAIFLRGCSELSIYLYPIQLNL